MQYSGQFVDNAIAFLRAWADAFSDDAASGGIYSTADLWYNG